MPALFQNSQKDLGVIKRQWSFAAENVAAGAATPQEAVTGWRNSSLQRANILSSQPREIGVGYVYAAADETAVCFDHDGDCRTDSIILTNCPNPAMKI